ncbi:GNAT family N-acetyltransferase [Microvirga sp. VF16]|uniref:GNAT family N-acetyltransferase n=1 Tax=Microvirga sp. VF16 TaxID=2807101 RepID=UPI00193D25CB|nr:GNAT family N-acetyltransferase [Microvirga sp. VF16]QRM27239.1 GNAT family N-acetyltransferase [Microvirga sp. VF16]
MLDPGDARCKPKLELARTDTAWDLLRSIDFREAWSELARICPWSTACQSWEFADAWLSAYQGTYEPLLVIQYNEIGRLIGLLPLAVKRGRETIEHVGAHQAEYQVWLATEINASSFIELALDELSKAYPGRRLQLQYLPPGSPMDWCTPQSRWGSRSILQKKRRPLLTLGSGSPAEISLRKKSNKSRISRLKKNGRLSLVTLETKEQLEGVLSTIADYCDLRQGAINASLPFKNDPLKREFYLRLMEKSGVVHASALMVGGTLAAANIGLINRASVDLGVVVHSPFLAEHSPGKILILMLAQELGRQGFRTLDLTPGGEMYKDRSADQYDQVYVLSIYFDRLKHARDALLSSIRIVAKELLGKRSQSVATIISHVRRLGLRHILINTVRSSLRSILGTNHTIYYAVSREEANRAQSQSIFRVNCISDLLCYEPASHAECSKSEFLMSASQRLQEGDCSYTLVENNILLHCSWISPHNSCRIEIRNPSSDSLSSSCLIWDDYTHPQASERNLSRLSLEQRLHDAVALTTAQNIIVQIGARKEKIKDNFTNAEGNTVGFTAMRTRAPEA